VVAVLAGCAVGPDYHRPDMPVAAQFKEAGEWRAAAPKDEIVRGHWWELYGDPVLNELEGRVDVSNQTLRAVEAQFRQAQAVARQARASFFPTLDLGVSATRSKSGSGTNTVVQGSTTVAGGREVTSRRAAADASWEPDVWGRIRRSVENARATASASAADLESQRLSIQAELAQDYFLLRVSDQQLQLFEDTAQAYERNLEITRNRYAVGVAGRVDVAQAEAQLRSTQSQLVDERITRAQLEHAIALLVGEAPAAFKLDRAPLQAKLPTLPVALPGELLERRPDIAAAERRVMAANASIGVATAAFFPSITLSGTYGYQSTSAADWFTAPSRFWSLGPALAQTLFDGGLRRAQRQEAIASYDQTVANYRETTLAAFQEVEDNLVALRLLEEESQLLNDALKSARETVALTLNQYKAGTVSYLNVVTVQATALSDERAAVTLLGRQFTSNVTLIRALGGGWTGEELSNAIADGR
jgi:NodT family efflux transporter outer membrane factor (OMF) lipoprotein